MMICLACGQVYRPVVIPCTAGAGVPGCPPESPATPANFHAVFGLSANVPSAISLGGFGYPGSAMQIDVSGASIIAESSVTGTGAPNSGLNLTHAALTPAEITVYVASASSVFAGGLDVVASFNETFQFAGGGFGSANTIALPIETAGITAISEAGNVVTVTANSSLNVVAGGTIVIAGVGLGHNRGYNGTFAIASITNSGSTTTITYINPVTGLRRSSGGTVSVPPQPVFLNSTQNTAMYAANYNSNSVSAINIVNNFVSNTATVGVNPVSLAETPGLTANGAQKLYVANQGNASVSGSVSSLNVTDLTPNTVTGFTGVNPVWAVARGDSQKIYVLTQGDGKLVTIDTATDSATTPDCSSTPTLCVGAGANFILFDPNLNRLYVTNPTTSMLYIFSDTGGVNDTPSLLTAISFGVGSVPCPAGCTPTSVSALPNGSQFFVASYQMAASCPDPVIGSLPCVIPALTVFDATSMTVAYPQGFPNLQYPTTPSPTLSLLVWAPPCTSTPCPTGPFATDQFAVSPLAACGPVVPGVPSSLYTPTSTRFRVFTTAAADSSAVYVSMCDAGVIAVINTNNNSANGSGIPADALITDLPAPFSNGPAQANGEPANQNPIFLLTGQ